MTTARRGAKPVYRYLDVLIVELAHRLRGHQRVIRPDAKRARTGDEARARCTQRKRMPHHVPPRLWPSAMAVMRSAIMLLLMRPPQSQENS